MRRLKIDNEIFKRVYDYNEDFDGKRSRRMHLISVSNSSLDDFVSIEIAIEDTTNDLNYGTATYVLDCSSKYIKVLMLDTFLPNKDYINIMMELHGLCVEPIQPNIEYVEDFVNNRLF